MRINLSTSDDLHQPQGNWGLQVVVQTELISKSCEHFSFYFLFFSVYPCPSIKVVCYLSQSPRRTTSFWVFERCWQGLSTSIPGNNLRTQGNMYLSGFHLDTAGDPDTCRLQKADFLHHKKNMRTKATLWDDNYGIWLSSTIRGFEKQRDAFLRKRLRANIQAAAVVFVSHCVPYTSFGIQKWIYSTFIPCSCC